MRGLATAGPDGSVALAETVKTMPARWSRYPWDSWSDGRVWQAKRGVDFHVAPGAFRSALSHAAKRRGMRVATHTKGDTVWFQFLHGDTPDDLRELTAPEPTGVAA